MLDSISHDGTGDMEGYKESQDGGGDGVWFRQPVRDGGKITLGNFTGASGDGSLLVNTIPPASGGGSTHHVISFQTWGSQYLSVYF